MQVIIGKGVYRRVTAGYLDAVQALHSDGHFGNVKWTDLQDLLIEMGWSVEPLDKVEREGANEKFDASGRPFYGNKMTGVLAEVLGPPPYEGAAWVAERLASHMDSPRVKRKQPKKDWFEFFREPAPWYFGGTGKLDSDISPGYRILSFKITPTSKLGKSGTLEWSDDGSMAVTVKYANVLPGVRITNPAGKSTVVDPDERISRIGSALDRLKFKLAFKQWSRGSTKTRKKTRTPERTMENTGTCAICGRNVKLDGQGMMWDHGYQLPWGQGGRTSGCFGTGWPPYEKSFEACEAYIERLEKILHQTEKKIINADEVEQLPHPHKRGETVKQNSKYWSTAFQRYLQGLHRTVKVIPREIEIMQAKVDNWKVKPLPGD